MASFIPVAAIMLARADARARARLAGRRRRASTRARTAFRPRRSRRRSGATRSCTSSSTRDFWHYAQNGRHLQTFCVGAAQLDHVRQREQLRDRRRLPPAEGAPARHGRPRRHGLARQAAPLLEHEPQPARRSSRRSTSSRAAGYLGGGDEREQLGLTAARSSSSRTSRCSTSSPESKRMRLRLGPSGRRPSSRCRRRPASSCSCPDGDVPETREADARAGAAAARGDRPGRDVQARGGA